MKTYTWQVTLLASIKVRAATRDRSEQKLRKTLSEMSLVAGVDERLPIVAGLEIEGSTDLVDVSDDEQNSIA